jgi:hypothetical protein
VGGKVRRRGVGRKWMEKKELGGREEEGRSWREREEFTANFKTKGEVQPL